MKLTDIVQRVGSSLSRKLAMISLLSASVLAVIALFSFSAARQVDRSLVLIENRDLPSQVNARRLAELFDGIAKRHEEVALTGQRTLLIPNLEASRSFRRELESLSEAIADDTAMDLTLLASSFDDFEAWQRGQTEAVLNHDSNDALASERFEHLGAAAAVARNRVDKNLKRLIEERRLQLSTRLDTVRENLATVASRILTLAIVSTMIWGFLFLYTRRRIARPIATLSHVADQIAGGRLDLDVESELARLPDGEDEVGQLAKDFGAMLRGLRETTVSMTHVDDIVRSLPDALIVVDHAGLIRTVNPATVTLLGGAPGRFVGKPLASLLADVGGFADAAGLSLWFTALCDQRTEVLGIDGAPIPVLLSVAMLRHESEDIAGGVVVIRDMREQLRAEHERQRLERKLFQAAKLESIGRLAAGVAHEINTPMQFIGDNTRFVSQTLQGARLAQHSLRKLITASREDGTHEPLVAEAEALIASHDLDYRIDEAISAISQTIDGIHRVRDIVAAMKDFSHPGSERKGEVDINRALRSTLRMSHNEWKRVAEIEEVLDPDLPAAHGVAGPLSQMFLNLIVNASHAIADTDVVRRGGKGKIYVATRALDDDRIEIVIRDTGGGIPGHIRDSIFDPFFTTKEVGRGTGQGLAIARAVVVDQHAGSIDVDTDLGVGTAMIIRLPTVARATERERAERELAGAIA